MQLSARSKYPQIQDQYWGLEYEMDMIERVRIAPVICEFQLRATCNLVCHHVAKVLQILRTDHYKPFRLGFGVFLAGFTLYKSRLSQFVS